MSETSAADPSRRSSPQQTPEEALREALARIDHLEREIKRLEVALERYQDPDDPLLARGNPDRIRSVEDLVFQYNGNLKTGHARRNARDSLFRRFSSDKDALGPALASERNKELWEALELWVVAEHLRRRGRDKEAERVRESGSRVREQVDDPDEDE